MTPQAPILEFLSVCHEYVDSKREPPFLALDSISFAVERGEFVSLIGPSGCGKSTLIRLAAGLIQPSYGRVSICGEEPRIARQSRSVGVIFQEPGLVPWRNILQNVALAGELAGLDRETRESRARDLLKKVELSGFEGFSPSQLSGGMKRRVAIARALMLHPQLLLMDEPFGALDQITRERLQLDFASTWSFAEVTALFVTHDVEEAIFMSDRIVVLTPAPARAASFFEIGERRPRRESFRTSESFFAQSCAVREALRRASGNLVGGVERKQAEIPA